MPEIQPGEFVDLYVNMPSPTVNTDVDPNIRKWFAQSSPDILGGVTPEQMFAKMDAAGIQVGFLCKGLGPVYKNPYLGGNEDLTLEKYREYCQGIADVCKMFPGRLVGTAMIDPTQGMNAVRMVEIAVREFGFKLIRMMGALTNIPPNHPLCWPVYCKAIELGVPVSVNVGVPGPLRFAKFQRPMDLDEVMVSLPELKLAVTHIGHPWHLETVALLQKHANFYLLTSGFAPKHIPEEIIHFMNTRGQHKVLWAADYPIQPFERCAREAQELPLRPGVLRRYMRENAMELFQLG
ncbi:MAG: amidohydrolase family protein [Dehalococcoidia bacterium]